MATIEKYLSEILMVLTATVGALILAMGLTASAESQLEKAKTAQVRVRHEAQVGNTNIELGAIADVSSTDVGNEHVLEHLILGESPAPGTEVVWTTAEITKRLHPYSKFLQSAHLTLPDQIKIERVKNTTVTRAMLKSQIEEAFKTTLPDSTWSMEVADLKMSAPLELPQDGSVQVVPPMTRPRGATNFEVLINKDGQAVRRLWIAGQVKYTASVATTRRQIDAHTRVSDSDVVWQKKEATFMTEIPATTLDMSTAVAKAAIAAGTVLTRSMLEREMALNFGDAVEVDAGVGDLVVTTKGISQQNAFVGDTVRVRVGMNKTLTGVVTAKGVVHVQ